MEQRNGTLPEDDGQGTGPESLGQEREGRGELSQSGCHFQAIDMHNEGVDEGPALDGEYGTAGGLIEGQAGEPVNGFGGDGHHASGPEGFRENRDGMLRVLRNHRRACIGVAAAGAFEGLNSDPAQLDGAHCPWPSLVERAETVWNEAYELGAINGFRNAQVSVVAPTGTIGLVMDCDTTGT